MTMTPLRLATLPLIITFVAVSICCLGIEETRADTLVVPNYATNSQVGSSAESMFTDTVREQTVYGASEFPPYPIVITQIKWRPDVYQNGPVTSSSISNIQISLSTTKNSADHLNSAFGQNTGSDDTVVFSGALVLSTSFTTLSNGTMAFDENIPLQTQFTYDPSQGNLLIEIRNFSGSTAAIYDNAVGGGSDSVSRIVSSDPNGTSASFTDTGGGAMQITYIAASIPPAITTQPTNQVVPVGGTATFAVGASSASTLAYHWFFNDMSQPIDNATNSSLTLTNLQTSQSGRYFVQVSNSVGSTFSSNAVLTVTAAPIIILQPANQAALVGGSTTFSVITTSSVPVMYQWYFNSTNLINGATNASLTVTNAQYSQGGLYSVQVTNVNGSVISSNASLAFAWIVPSASTNIQTFNADSSFNDVDREQTIYGASDLPPFPVIISEFRFRPDQNAGGPFVSTLPNIQLNLSTSQSQPDNLNSTFSANIGPDNTLVYSGTLTVSTAFTTLTNGTKDFDIRLPFQVPFLYNPSHGNLLLDLRNFNGCTPSEPSFINIAGATDSTSRLVAFDANGASGNFHDTGGYVLEVVYNPAPVPPTISVQPQSFTNTVGSEVTLRVTAGPMPLSYQWFFNDVNTPIADATNSSLTLSNIQPDQAGNYFVQATDQYGATLSSNAVLTVTTDPPSITSQPVNHSGIVGTNFTFSVSATGSLPLTYQWFYNTNTPLDGATNSSLLLTNIEFNQSGTYSVVVSNAYGVTNSAYAVLTMSFPPVNVLMGSTNIMGGNSFSLPVFLLANGNENALSFSVNFDTQELTYASVDLGSGAADAALLPNTSQAAAGRLGITMQLPPGEAFVPGTQEVARVRFLSTNIFGTQVVTPINFTNQPINRFVFDVQGNKLATNFLNGSVTLGVTDFEGDVNPRPAGDHSLDIFDFSEVGRFVAGLDTISNAEEFQRADCAPKSTSGDGQLKVTDWVQAGRYGAAIDSPTVVGGPTAPVVPVTVTGGPRIINLAGGVGVEGLNVTVPVVLQSQGNENGVGFSVNFNPALLKYVGTVKGSADASATLLVNTNESASGTVGVVLALPAGNTFTNGTQSEIARLTFTALNAMTNSDAALTNGPVLLAVSDPAANELPAIYTNGVITINPPPTLNASITDTNAALSWPTWGTGFNLQATSDLTQPWTNVVFTPQTNGGNIIITLPMSGQGGYFRLQHP